MKRLMLATDLTALHLARRQHPNTRSLTLIALTHAAGLLALYEPTTTWRGGSRTVGSPASRSSR